MNNTRVEICTQRCYTYITTNSVHTGEGREFGCQNTVHYLFKFLSLLAFAAIFIKYFKKYHPPPSPPIDKSCVHHWYRPLFRCGRRRWNGVWAGKCDRPTSRATRKTCTSKRSSSSNCRTTWTRCPSPVSSWTVVDCYRTTRKTFCSGMYKNKRFITLGRRCVHVHRIKIELHVEKQGSFPRHRADTR